MNDEQILDIFYTQIVPEAQLGKIDCYFAENIIFNLTINNQVITRREDPPYDGTLMPTLKITNKKTFDKLLVEYVQKALEFYDPSNFLFLNNLGNPYIKELESEEKEVYLIKYIICSLLANASFQDFDNPIYFLEDRIAMFDSKIIKNEEEVELGYIKSINARMYIKEEKAPIKAETPYRIKSHIVFDDGYSLKLPELYVGKGLDTYKIYGVQKKEKSNEEEEWSYLKKIRPGLIAKINGAPEHYFLAIMLLLSLCRNEKIEVIPFLVERWNAKKIALTRKAKREPFVPEKTLEDIQDKLQINITNLLLRYFTKLEDVTEGINFESLPYEIDSNMHIKVEENINSRSKAFNELFDLVKTYQNNTTKKVYY